MGLIFANMKAFIVLSALAAVAVNATEDDPYHYTLIKKEGPGWDLKALPAPAHPHPYYYAHPYGYWGRKKRDAEPDTVNGVPLAYGHGLVPAVAPVAVPHFRTAAVTGVEHQPGEVTHTVTPVVAHVAPYAYPYWGRKKREAEADADASAWYYGYYGHGYTGYYGIHPSHYGICHNNLGARVPC